MNAVYHNGITVAVRRIPGQKRPRLCVRFDDENANYEVANFKDEQTARWFCEVMEEFFKDVMTKEEHENKEQEVL